MSPEYLKGRELLDPPFNLTKRSFFQLIKDGKLVPWGSPDAEYIRRHRAVNFPERMHRIFPTDRLTEKYRKLLGLEYALSCAQEWHSKSNGWHIEGYKHDRNLNWDPPPFLQFDLETYINEILPKERQEYLRIIKEYPAKIEKVEKELAPDKVWNDLDIGPEQKEILMEKLLDAWYPSNQVEAISIHEPQELTGLCKPGTQWKDITITLVSNEMVRIKTPDTENLLTYHNLGMADKRKGDSPIILWVLLKIFAQNNGFISSQNQQYDPKLPDTAKRLNYHLQKLFRIKESIYVGHYKKEKGYRTKIKFKDATYRSPTD